MPKTGHSICLKSN